MLTHDYETEGVTVPAGTRVVLLYAAANRDERKYPDPDRFDVARDPMDHVAFGAGVHGCRGQHMALMQAGSLMTAFASRVRRFELAGQPGRTSNVITTIAANAGLDGITAPVGRYTFASHQFPRRYRPRRRRPTRPRSPL